MYTEILAITVFIITILSTMAGIGGGAVLLAAFVYLGGYDLHHAVPLVIVSILGASTVKFAYFVGKRDSDNPNRYLINYPVLLQLVTFDSSLAVVGYILNNITPDLVTKMIVIAIISLLVITVFRKAYQKWRIPEEEPLTYADDLNYEAEHLSLPIDSITVSVNKQMYETIISTRYISGRDRTRYIAFLGSVCLFLVTLSLIRFNLIVDKNRWIIILVQIIILTSVGGLVTIFNHNTNALPIRKSIQYSGVACMTSILSTFVGIGGGMIMNPFLLHMNMSVPVVGATGGSYTFFSSIASYSQYIDRIDPITHSLFFILSVIASGIGIFIWGHFAMSDKQYILIILLGCLLTTALGTFIFGLLV